jgi:hypothetical protein
MIKWRRAGQPLQIACALALFVALAGCGTSYTLQDRIRDLEAQGYNTAQPERRARPQTHARGKSRTRQADAAEGAVSQPRPAAVELTPTARSTNDANVVEPQARPRDGGMTTGEGDAPAARDSRWRPAPGDKRRAPEADSPEGEREQVEKDRVLDRKIRSICRSC